MDHDFAHQLLTTNWRPHYFASTTSPYHVVEADDEIVVSSLVVSGALAPP